MDCKTRITGTNGITIVEIAILLVIGGLVLLGSMQYYQARVKLRDSKAALVASRGNLGVILDEFQRQILAATPNANKAPSYRIARTRDTLEIYFNVQDSDQVDTMRYFVNRFDHPPSLIEQKNSTTPSVFAPGVDSVLFVAAETEHKRELSVVLVSPESQLTEADQPKRLGQTIALGAP
jgi:hypothetical protein